MKKFLNCKMIAIFCLGFAAGIPLALILSTYSNWLSRIGLSNKTIGLMALVGTPYTIKFIWSFCFDAYKVPYLHKIFGRRISWLLVTQLLLIVSIISLGSYDPVNSIKISSMIAISVAFFSASQDIIIDAIRIEISDKEELSLSSAMYIYGYRVAMLVSGGGALYLSAILSWQEVYFYMSMCILVGVFSGLYLSKYKALHVVSKINDEHPDDQVVVSALRKIYDLIVPPFREFLSRKYSIIILILVISYKLSDAFIGVMSSKFYVDAGFTNIQIASVVKVYGFAMTLLGTIVPAYFMRKMSILKFLMISCILQSLSNLLFIPIIYNPSDITYLAMAISIDNFCGSISNIAIIVYLSSLCNINFTASQYALLSSLSAVGRTFLSAPSGYIVEMLGWNGFFIFSVFLCVPAIVIMMFLKYKESIS
jgi:MFS transporter, PAT family, beta-lactamase induction signal transducer AmpG